jgi:nicotinamide-nucleotide amidase
VHKVIRTIGLGESFLAEKIEHWEDNLPNHIKLAYLPNFGQVKLRLTGIGNDRESLKQEIEVEVDRLVPLIEQYIYSKENEEIEEVIGNILKNNEETVSVAESCTGGYLSHLFTSIAGSSAYFMGGVISYSNEAKMEVLNVKRETLTKFGAVSEQTIIEMAENVRKLLGTTYGIATSGIAGPGGGSSEKPVGTVWIAVSNGQKTLTKKLQLGKIRVANIQYSAKAALDFLRTLTKGK